MQTDSHLVRRYLETHDLSEAILKADDFGGANKIFQNAIATLKEEPGMAEVSTVCIYPLLPSKKCTNADSDCH